MMTDIHTKPASAPQAADSAQPAQAVVLPSPEVLTPESALALPTARRTLIRLLRAWLVGLIVFGYGPAFTYGRVAWLFNEHQWWWTYFLYVTEVPLVGGFWTIVVPLISYWPVHRALNAWAAGAPVDRAQCAQIYERALVMPWRAACGAFAASFFVYLIGMTILHWQTNQPWVEIAKTVPAIPLVGGMMGAYCYFGTTRALQPVVAWCSRHLRNARPVRQVSLAEKFLATTVVLAIALLCLLQPAAYSLGQVVTERHMSERALGELRTAGARMAQWVRQEDQLRILQQAALGEHGYVMTLDEGGRITSPHPRGYTMLAEERFYRPERHLDERDGVWVDRFGQHRVIAFTRLSEPPQVAMSVSFPSDFSQPLHEYMQFSWVIILEVLFVVFLFGRSYTRGITTPLAELSLAAEQIAEHGDLTQYVAVTTNDELGELARSFNRMVEELQASKATLEEHAKRLERSTQELSLLNQEMEDLLRVVSHDLRAPLINIQGFSKRLEPIMQEMVKSLDQLAAQHPDQAALRAQVDTLRGNVQARFTESLRFISKGVEKMDALLASLLAVSRVGRKADPIQPHDLDGILDDVIATFDHQLKEQAIQVIRHPLPRGVRCRRNEVNQVFSNLVSNAISYMGASGNRFIEIGGAVDGELAECYIRDTGIGISPEDHERVFQMFTRLLAVEVPGEGVGLAYVKKILRSHGGTIRVMSQKGQGSTFYFTLPIRETAAQGGLA